MTKRRGDAADFPLENAALGLLVVGPKHGYELYRDFLKTFSPIWKAGRSKFYAALADLNARGFLDATVEPQTDRPPRKVYHITEVGRQFLMEWLYQPVTPIHQCRVELLAKLRFFDLLGLSDVSRLIDAQLGVCYAALQRIREQEAGDDPLYRLVYSFREKRVKALIEWLGECESSIRDD